MPDASASGTSAPAPVRLVQRVVEVDGRRVGVATAGRGTPLVMVHGFGVESLLYAQPLARLVGLGFRVYALDIAGHGATDSVGMCAALDGYCDLVERTVEQLGIQRALFMGHSMGGRIVAEVVARDPQRAIALVLLDPIAGASWDAMRPWLRWFPPALALYGAAAVVDVTSTLPALVDARQAIRFEPEVLNLGEMSAEVAKTGTIKVVNVLDVPVTITKIVPGCGCTTTSVTGAKSFTVS